MDRHNWIRAAGIVAAALLAPAAAAQDWKGLGATWPNAPDVSRVAEYHAYKWISHGVSYIQISDAMGQPVAAVAVAHGQAIVLPVGRHESVALAAAGQTRAGRTVFDDGAVSISDAGGSFQVLMAPADQCSDPIECGKALTTTTAAPQVQTMAAEEPCKDPIECGKSVQ